MDGGIFGLLGLIRDHRGAVEYDLRHRFGLGLRDVGETVTIAEVARLVVIMRADPSSAIAAALEGWKFPISREALALYDVWDLLAQVNSDPKKPPKARSGRPYEIDDREVTRRGDMGDRTPEQVKELLRKARAGELHLRDTSDDRPNIALDRAEPR